jgi:hypothetical protein
MNTEDIMDPWLNDTGEKIRCLNYEIDICPRIFSSSLAFHHMSTFNDAMVYRNKLIAQVMHHLDEQIKTQTHNQHETVTQPKPTSVPNNVIRLPRRQLPGNGRAPRDQGAAPSCRSRLSFERAER